MNIYYNYYYNYYYQMYFHFYTYLLVFLVDVDDDVDVISLLIMIDCYYVILFLFQYYNNKSLFFTLQTILLLEI